MLLNVFTARCAVDFRNSLQGTHRLVDIADQKSGLSVVDDLTARAEVHGDDGHARGVSFRENQPDSLLHLLNQFDAADTASFDTFFSRIE